MTSATARIWRLRDRRIPAVAAASALTGLAPSLLRDASRVSLAASREAEALVTAMPNLVRGLPMTLTDALERCENEVRGPVVWSETLTARANALGSEDVFVCSTARRDFDGPANRMLVAVLLVVAAAGKALRGPVADLLAPEDVAELEARSVAARQWRHHPRLSDVPPRMPNVRDMSRIRHGRHAGSFEVVFAAHQRTGQPFEESDLDGLTDPATTAMHATVLEAVLGTAERLGTEPVLGFSDGALRLGPLSFRHPDGGGAAPSGLAVAGRAVSDLDDLWGAIERSSTSGALEALRAS